MKKVFIILGIFLVVLIGWLSVPFNILIIGVDAYANQPTEGSRSDGLVVIRVVPYLAQIKMISIRTLKFLVKIISRIKLRIRIILEACNVLLTL